MARIRPLPGLCHLGILVLLTGGSVLPTGCQFVPDGLKPKQEAPSDTGGDKEKKAADKKKDDTKSTASKPDAAGSVDVGFLLSMSYNEARQLSPQSIELPPYYKVAADEIIVVSKKSDGTPRKVRAKGHVFLQIDLSGEISALGQEALVGGSEVILRGKPLLRRGRSVVEGLEDRTVFYIDGVRLQAIGMHRLTNESGVTASWRGSWKEGPNPLLPALSPGDVPKEMRASPLLPPVSKDDLPKKRR